MGSDDETQVLLKAIGRAIEEQGQATRLVLTLGFAAMAAVAVLVALLVA